MQDRWQQVEQLYHAALERPAGERSAFLASQCDDSDVLEEVVSLLAQESKSGLLAHPTHFGEDGFPGPLSVGATMGPYAIEALIGKGGMGEVFRATDTRLGRHVAIKACDARFSERFNREARAISSLNHPNICTLHDVGPNFIVMELVEGETLAGLLKKGPLGLDTALGYGLQIAGALAEAHGQNVVHRDLKPANVMVSRHGVKVLDFGLAKIVSASGIDFTKTNAVMGTPAYMAPEQVEGKPADARADLFALGLMLYEMAAGQLPFPGASLGSMLISGSVAVPPPSKFRPGIPAEFDALVARLLLRDPSARAQTAAEVREVLVKLASRPEPMGLLRPALALAALVALGAGGWYIAQQLAPGNAVGASISAFPLVNFTGIESDPSFSPDGTQLAFSWLRPEVGTTKAYVMAVGSQTPRPLVDSPSDQRHPTWSPDGRQIAFLARGATVPNWDVSVVSTGGGAARKIGAVRLTESQILSRALGWTPDSKSLVLVTLDDAQRGVLALLSVEQGTMRPLNIPIRHGLGGPGGDDPDLTSPAVSPDGKWLAYIDGRLVMAQPLNANYEPEGPPASAPEGYLRSQLAWLGSRLVYSAGVALSDGRLLEWDLKNPPKQFWAGAPVGGPIAIHNAGGRIKVAVVSGSLVTVIGRRSLDPVRKIFAGDELNWPTVPYSNITPDYAPGGNQIAFGTNRAARPEVWISNPDGTEARQLSTGAMLLDSRWSRDGRRLAAPALRTGELKVLDLDSGIARDLPNSPKGTWPEWSADGRYLYAVQASRNIVRIRLNDGAVEPIGTGDEARETADGKSLIVSRRGDGLFSRPVTDDIARGPETRLVKELVASSRISVIRNGVYYLVTGTDGKARTFRYFDLGTGQSHDVGPLTGSGYYVTVSPDEREMIFSRRGGAVDLTLLEFEAAQ